MAVTLWRSRGSHSHHGADVTLALSLIAIELGTLLQLLLKGIKALQFVKGPKRP